MADGLASQLNNTKLGLVASIRCCGGRGRGEGNTGAYTSLAGNLAQITITKNGKIN